MRDVRQTRHKLQQLRNNLLSTDMNQGISELGIFWKFVHSDPFIRPLVEELETEDSGYDAWLGQTLPESYQRGYRLPADEADRARLCLAILNPEQYKDADAIWSRGFELSLNRGTGGGVDNVTRSFFEAFLPPVYQYLDHLLMERESMVTPSDVMLEILDSTEGASLGRFQSTVSALKAAYADLYTSSGTVVFQNVGNSCRSALISFATDIYSDSMRPEGEPAPKGDDAVRRIQFALRASVPNVTASEIAWRAWSRRLGIWLLPSFTRRTHRTPMRRRRS